MGISTVEGETIRLSQTSAINHPVTQRHVPEERRPLLRFIVTFVLPQGDVGILPQIGHDHFIQIFFNLLF
jgi:hypothetical protein